MFRKGDFMATSTFDKTICIDQEAAEKMAMLSDEPSPPRPNLGDDFWQNNERKLKEWLSCSKKSSQTIVEN